MREARDTEDVILNALEGIEGRHWIKDRILTALSSAGIDCEGWRDIESAPKDGSRVLLAKFVGHPAHPTALWWATLGHWSAKWNNWNDGVEPAGLAGPTHWRPRPLPPLASGGG